jgi:hypothetical protein
MHQLSTFFALAVRNGRNLAGRVASFLTSSAAVSIVSARWLWYGIEIAARFLAFAALVSLLAVGLFLLAVAGIGVLAYAGARRPRVALA